MLVKKKKKTFISKRNQKFVFSMFKNENKLRNALIQQSVALAQLYLAGTSFVEIDHKIFSTFTLPLPKSLAI